MIRLVKQFLSYGISQQLRNITAATEYHSSYGISQQLWNITAVMEYHSTKIPPCLIISTAIRIAWKESCVLHLRFASHCSYGCSFCYAI